MKQINEPAPRKKMVASSLAGYIGDAALTIGAVTFVTGSRTNSTMLENVGNVLFGVGAAAKVTSIILDPSVSNTLEQMTTIFPSVGLGGGIVENNPVACVYSGGLLVATHIAHKLIKRHTNKNTPKGDDDELDINC